MRTTRTKRTKSPRIDGSVRGTRLVVVAIALALATFVSACGGDGDGDGNGNGNGTPSGPEDAFLGIWLMRAAPEDTNFRLTCPAIDNGMTLAFSFWSALVFERGEVTDLFELSGGCALGLPYDVNDDGTAAVPVNPDPFTGAAPSCGVLVDLRAAPTDPEAPGILELLPADQWSFTLRPAVAGEPREGDLGGSASVRLTTFDANGLPVLQEPCTFTGTDRFQRLTRS